MSNRPSEPTQPQTHAPTEPPPPAAAHDAAERAAADSAQDSAHEPGPDPQAAIDAAMAALNRLHTVPAGEHAEAFDRVHTALADALSAIDGV